MPIEERAPWGWQPAWQLTAFSLRLPTGCALKRQPLAHHVVNADVAAQHYNNIKIITVCVHVCCLDLAPRLGRVLHIQPLGQQVANADDAHQVVHIALNAASDARVLDLHHHAAPIVQHAAVHLQLSSAHSRNMLQTQSLAQLGALCGTLSPERPAPKQAGLLEVQLQLAAACLAEGLTPYLHDMRVTCSCMPVAGRYAASMEPRNPGTAWTLHRQVLDALTERPTGQSKSCHTCSSGSA